MDILRDENNEKPLVIVSGWSDGGVRRYHLDDVPIDSHETLSFNQTIENDYPRNVVFFNSLLIIVQMNSGQLWKVDHDQRSIFYDGRETLKNGYAKMSVGNEWLAVGSLHGSVFVFDRNGTMKNEFQIETNGNRKILQILWLDQSSSSKLLVCIPDGIMVISMRKRESKKSFFLSLYPFFSLSSTFLTYVTSSFFLSSHAMLILSCSMIRS